MKNEFRGHRTRNLSDMLQLVGASPHVHTTVRLGYHADEDPRGPAEERLSQLAWITKESGRRYIRK